MMVVQHYDYLSYLMFKEVDRLGRLVDRFRKCDQSLLMFDDSTRLDNRPSTTVPFKNEVKRL